MSKIPGFIEVERRVLRIAGARMDAKNGTRGTAEQAEQTGRDIGMCNVVLW